MVLALLFIFGFVVSKALITTADRKAPIAVSGDR